ncbi:hypothetical protein [Rouxiella chamberiensis]|uniref:Peptidase C14 n=1 Tax=Rouxiella chamberiensis TaxID=1513468 RepID=A0ABY7HND1_9GAMM|nr:hypothetical protein [Rouxiella chamberiensis]WAT00376.1 hypothetical protein O1V66_15690 [Rouxiella chamberiensis]
MINRRELLSGVAGGVVSAGLLTAAAANPASIVSVNNVSALRKRAAPGDRLCAVVLGYHFAGDGGGKLMYWDAANEQTANDGTVIALPGSLKGRWLLLHNGTLDFRQFGIFNGENGADAALDAMVNDPQIHRIEAHTALNFRYRHQFSRSDITLDFGGQTVTTSGLDALENIKDNYLSAILAFRGEVEEKVTVSPLLHPLPLLSEIYPVEDSSQFPVGQWFCLESEKMAGHWQRKIQRLVQVTAQIDATHVRLNYRTGWPLEAGKSLHWRKVTPVKNVLIQNMQFIGQGELPDTSSQPVTFEYAIYCDVYRIHAQGTFWSVIFRRWNTFFRTEQCSLSNPPSVSWGGAGYLTQQIYCQYGHIADCTTSNARHLNDLTASSSCVVQNCHSDGDSTGAFVTHGQYEHDLQFIGNSGIITLANSGVDWGQTAARIAISQHVCSVLIANTFISDLTLTDVHVYRDVYHGGLGILRLHCDGLTVRNCSVNGELTLIQHEQHSPKMNLFDNCAFTLDARHDSTISDLELDDPYIDSHPLPTSRNSFQGNSRLHFSHCTFEGETADTSLLVNNHENYFSGCKINNLALVLLGEVPQKLVIDGETMLTAEASSLARISRRGVQPVTWLLGPLRSEVNAVDALHIEIEGGINYYQARHATFVNGKRRLMAEAFSLPSYFIEQDNLLLAVESEMPSEAEGNGVINNTQIVTSKTVLPPTPNRQGGSH